MAAGTRPTSPAQLMWGLIAAVTVSVALLALAMTVALLGGGAEVAGSFFLTFLALLVLAAAAIGFARLVHGDDPDTVDVEAGQATTRRLFGGLALLGALFTAFLAILTPFPYALAAALPLVVVAVLARGARTHSTPT